MSDEDNEIIDGSPVRVEISTRQDSRVVSLCHERIYLNAAAHWKLAICPFLYILLYDPCNFFVLFAFVQFYFYIAATNAYILHKELMQEDSMTHKANID